MPGAPTAAACMSAAAGMRCRTTYRSTITITMHIAPPFIAAAKKIHIRLRHHHRAAVTSTHVTSTHVTSVHVTSVHVTHTSCQGRQQRNPQPNLDQVNRTVRLVHTDLPFAEEIKNQVTGC